MSDTINAQPQPQAVDKIGTVEIPEIVATFDGLYLIPTKPLNAGDHLMTISQHRRMLADAQRLLAERDAEIAELDALRNRLSDLLSQSIVAIRGPEPELTRFGWAGLPTRVKTVVNENARLSARVVELVAVVRDLDEWFDNNDASPGYPLEQRMQAALNQPSSGKGDRK